MAPGTFAFRVNVPVKLEGGDREGINIPIDAAIMRRSSNPRGLSVADRGKIRRRLYQRKQAPEGGGDEDESPTTEL